MSTMPVSQPSPVLQQPVASKFFISNSISAQAFIRQFPQDYNRFKIITTDELAFSNGKAIISFEIGDCINIFGIEYSSSNTIDKISAFHASSSTTESELICEYLEWLDKQSSYAFFIIGGNSSTTSDSVDSLLQVIRKTIGQYFEKDSCIEQELLDLNANTSKNFVHAALTMEGNVFYCTS